MSYKLVKEKPPTLPRSTAIFPHVVSDYGLTCGQTQKTGLFQPQFGKEQAHSISPENARSPAWTDTADTPSEEVPAFVPTEGKYRKRGTGYVKQLSATCWQGRYTPRVDGKRVSYNVYGKTEEECEAKLAEVIKEVKRRWGGCEGGDRFGHPCLLPLSAKL